MTDITPFLHWIICQDGRRHSDNTEMSIIMENRSLWHCYSIFYATRKVIDSRRSIESPDTTFRSCRKKICHLRLFTVATNIFEIKFYLFVVFVFLCPYYNNLLSIAVK
jgi:hypothetical protein